MKLGGVKSTRWRTFVQLPFTFLCELCAFARDNGFHVFPGRLGLGRCSICFSQRRKARKGKSKAKSRRSRSFAGSQRPTKWKFPESEGAAARLHTEEELRGQGSKFLQRGSPPTWLLLLSNLRNSHCSLPAQDRTRTIDRITPASPRLGVETQGA